MKDASRPEPDPSPALESYAPALRRYFRRHLERADAEDLVQEVFIGMQARQTGDVIRNLNGYIFSVAANVLRNHRRQRALAWDADGPPGASDTIPSDAPSPERTMLGREGLARAMAIIRALPPRTRDIFVLHRFEELSYPAIASRVGISVSAVEKHMMAALRALSELRSQLR